MMIKCQTCGSTRFTKESNYLICEYCGTNRKTDPLVLEKKKTQSNGKYYAIVLMAAVVGLFVLNSGQKDQERSPHEVSNKRSIVNTSPKKHNLNKFTNHPKITVKNDTSTIGTQVIQTTEDLAALSVNNRHSQIDTQVIQSKKSIKVGHQNGNADLSKAIPLSIEKTVYNSKGEILSHTKKIHHKPKENYIDKDGIEHRTVYTKLPKIDYKNEYLQINNANVKMQKQQVSFYIDEKDVKHYRALTENIEE